MLEKFRFLKRDKFTSQRKNSEPAPKRDMVSREQEAWKSVLGTEVKIEPVPEYLKNPQVNENLLALGMEPVYIPQLHLGTPNDLKLWGEKKFINEMSQKYFYPDWKRYEGLTKKKQVDHKISRNLNEWYWGEVKKGNVGFPELKGSWVAVETMPKPSRGKKYPDSEITKILGFPNRFSISWNEAKKAMKEKKNELLARAGLPDNYTIRLPEVIEWNLLANRFGWGKTDSYEWTNTKHHLFEGYLVIGNSDMGGAANVLAGAGDPKVTLNFIGFRVMIDLPHIPA